MPRYTVQWKTKTTHQATLEAESDKDLFHNFGFHTYDCQQVADENYIEGSFHIVKIESKVQNG